MSAKIYLIAESHFDVEAFLQFLSNQPIEWSRSTGASDAEELVEAAGRVCYMSFGRRQSPKSNTDYIRHLIRMGHESVLEHVSWTFVIEGVSRAFSHQFVRHRVGFAISQLSQQYHDETEAHFVEPPQLKQFPEALAIWQQQTQASRDAYIQILDIVSTRQNELSADVSQREATRAIHSIARSVLPNAAETKLVVTANARALRHFLRVRGTIVGDVEMRIVSAQLLTLLRPHAPSLFFDFEVEQLGDGFPIIQYMPA